MTCHFCKLNPSQKIVYVYVPRVPVTLLLPVFFVLIALLLSWNIMFRLISYLCDSINRSIQMLYGRYSLTLTTLAPVELFVLNLCLMELQCTSTYPNDIPSPVWLFRYGCNPYSASTFVHICMRLSSPITLLLLILCFRKCSTRLNFVFSSAVLLVTLVHRNDIFG